jgi:enoyl-CoA hydratase/carnithine racemase
MIDPVLVTRAEGVATITLNRPGKLNSLDLAMWRRLETAMRELSSDAAIRCVLVRGAGDAFAAGADLAEFETERNTPQAAASYSGVMQAALTALRDCPHPIVAQIHGACVGAGLEIAIMCDLRIATESSRFGVPIQRIGVAMPCFEIAALVELVGRATALEILLEGRVFPAAEAREKGLVTRVVSDSDLEKEAAAALRRIAEGAPLVHRWHKKFTRRSVDPRPLTPEEIAEGFATAGTADYRAGIRAFLSKQKPRFEGR